MARARGRMSPFGAASLAATVGIGLLAYKSGNNLYYALFALFLSLILLARLQNRLAAGTISVSRSFPDELYAGRAAQVRITASNHSRWWSAWAVTVRDLLDVPANLSGPSPCFPRIPPGGSSEAVQSVSFRRRGRYRARVFEAFTGFPFGFYVRRTPGAVETEFCVLPRPRRLPSALLPPLSEEAAWGLWQSSGIGEEDEFRELRDYRPGDPPRRIHWKTSARAGVLMIREMEAARRPLVTVLLDTWVPSGATRFRRRVSLERGIRAAASLAFELERRGLTYRFGVLTPEPVLTAFGKGRTHLKGLLEILAGLGPTPAGKPSDLFREAVRRCGPGTRFVLLLLGSDRAAEARCAASEAPYVSVQAFDASKPGLTRVL